MRSFKIDSDINRRLKNSYDRSYLVELEQPLAYTTRVTARRTLVNKLVACERSTFGIMAPGRFAPMYSIFFRELYNKHEPEVWVYYKPKVLLSSSEPNPTINSYEDLYRNLSSTEMVCGIYRFTVEGEDHFIYVGRQYLADLKGNILFMGACGDYLVNDKTEYVYYVASELYTNPIYKYVSKKLDSEYISEIRDQDIPVITMPSRNIQNKFFKCNVIGDKPAEVSLYLEDELKKNLAEKLHFAVSRDNTYYSTYRFYVGKDVFFPKIVSSPYTYKNLMITGYDENSSFDYEKAFAKLLIFEGESIFDHFDRQLGKVNVDLSTGPDLQYYLSDTEFFLKVSYFPIAKHFELTHYLPENLGLLIFKVKVTPRDMVAYYSEKYPDIDTIIQEDLIKSPVVEETQEPEAYVQQQQAYTATYDASTSTLTETYTGNSVDIGSGVTRADIIAQYPVTPNEAFLEPVPTETNRLSTFDSSDDIG